jgi:hypothetical protein
MRRGDPLRDRFLLGSTSFERPTRTQLARTGQPQLLPRRTTGIGWMGRNAVENKQIVWNVNVYRGYIHCITTSSPSTATALHFRTVVTSTTLRSLSQYQSQSHMYARRHDFCACMICRYEEAISMSPAGPVELLGLVEPAAAAPPASEVPLPPVLGSPGPKTLSVRAFRSANAASYCCLKFSTFLSSI